MIRFALARAELQIETRIRCNLYGTAYTCVTCNAFIRRVIICTGYIVKHTLNSLCHVVFIKEAFIDLKCSGELSSSSKRSRSSWAMCKEGVENVSRDWFDYKSFIIWMWELQRDEKSFEFFMRSRARVTAKFTKYRYE